MTSAQIANGFWYEIAQAWSVPRRESPRTEGPIPLEAPVVLSNRFGNPPSRARVAPIDAKTTKNARPPCSPLLHRSGREITAPRRIRRSAESDGVVAVAGKDLS